MKSIDEVLSSYYFVIRRCAYCNSDEDMQSIVSLMSVNNNSDIAPLDDLEDIPDLESYGDISEHVLDFTAQLEQLTNSLTNSELATPMSGMCDRNFHVFFS